MSSKSISAKPADMRRIASFGRRRGRRLRSSKAALFETCLPKFSITLPKTGKLDLTKLFSNTKETWLEIGFGGGEHLATQAQRHPQIGFIGCEPYINGISGLLSSITENDISNIRIYTDDARNLIEHLPSASIAQLFILFPDPWPKARHHKRRLISPSMLDELARIMKPGSQLRIATDHEGYLVWILQHMLAHEAFAWQAGKADDWRLPPVDWIQTRYEQKAQGEGRKSTYLNFIRT